ncbi:MAG: hypothetical protein IBX72_14370 [Nitrospirae bacterium]|nr:hypothetical protein [Nitrospirota bacterium]
MSNGKEIAKSIASILRILAEKIEENPDIINGIGLSLRDIPVANLKKKKEELPIDVDIFQIFSDEGEKALRDKLDVLDLKSLIRIVRKHGFDPSKLAEKWKKKERLVDLILDRVSARSNRGKVFKDYP